MKIVLTLEEVKNIICDFIQKREGGEKPKEIKFVIKQTDTRETEQLVEVIYD